LWIGLGNDDEGNLSPIIANRSRVKAEKQASDFRKSGLVRLVIVRPYRYDEVRQTRRKIERKHRRVKLPQPAASVVDHYQSRGVPQPLERLLSLSELHGVLDER
jgi:2'-5' RNA ligase